MAENLKTTHYKNGEEIQYSSSEYFASDEIGQYGIYDDDPSNVDIYGYLYNWLAAIDDRGICPTGFHVPSDEEFMELEIFLGVSGEQAENTGYRGTNEGSQLAGNSDLWLDGTLKYNPEFGTSGFNALPAGHLYVNFPSDINYSVKFWSSSEYSEYYAYFRQLFYYSPKVYRHFNNYKFTGSSIRCLEDEITTGCTDPEATNYDETATIDDGSCCIELWGECYNIETTTGLNLQESGLTGEIPHEIGNLVNLLIFSLYNNNLTGEIPHEIGQLYNLRALSFGNNQLSGEIPQLVANLNLEAMVYSDNQFSGTIPESICNSSANIYSFGNNKFCPPYPDCLNDYTLGYQDTSECPVSGCTDPEACNYDETATVDDGNCVFPDSICDTCSGETDGTGTAVDNDIDGDGICEDNDNCPQLSNPNQADADMDWVGDVCDNCGYNANTDQSDEDSDGVGDVCDGCPDSEVGATVDEYGCEYGIEATLSFGEVDLASQTIEIHLENSASVSGFQFLLSSDDSVDFVDVYGGSAEENGFTVDIGDNNIVLGFSLSATEIPTGSDVLTIVEFDGFTSNEICLSEGVITSGYEDAQYLDVSYGDCISPYLKGDVNMDGVLDVLDIVTIVNIIFETIDPDDYQLWASDYNSDGDINIMDIVQIVNAIFSDDVVFEGCMDDTACNYDESATADDGSCAYEFDCADDCGGSQEEDCTGTCGGTGELDECGVCGGDGSLCSYPAYGTLNFSVIDMTPVPGAGIYEYPLSAYVEDINSNPVADSIAVYFQIRENAAPWDILSNYNYNDKVTWFDGEATVLDSVVYTCIDNVNNCSTGITPDTDGSWLPSAHPAEIIDYGETGMASPFDGNSYPGVAFSKMIFGSSSIAAEVIVFASIINSDNSVFIIDSRTNHSGNGIVFPCYECSIIITALPTQWDFSLPPHNPNIETDFQDVTVSATVRDYFQFPVYNALILLDAPQADFTYVCGGEDTDLDGTTGDCTLVADGTTTLPLVQDCWTCVENHAPAYSWIVEDNDNNDIADSDGTLIIAPDDIPNYARTSSIGVGQWNIRYSEGVNIPQGDDPVVYQTFNTTITASLVTPSTNNPSESVTIIISKSEED